MRLPALCLLLAGFGPSGALAQPVRQARQTIEVTSIKALPAEIRNALGTMSDRGGPFAPGCVGTNGEPHSRFSTARLGADTASVTVERGGIAHFFEQRAFRKVDGRWVALPVALPVAQPAPAPGKG